MHEMLNFAAFFSIWNPLNIFESEASSTAVQEERAPRKSDHTTQLASERPTKADAISELAPMPLAFIFSWLAGC